MSPARIFKAMLCLQVYLASLLQGSWAVRQDMMGGGEIVRGHMQLQRGHFKSTLILHLFRLSGVGRVSEPAGEMKTGQLVGLLGFGSTPCSWLPA